MEQPPKPEYTVVERDGRLVVEKVEEARKVNFDNVRVPKLPPLEFDWIKLGQALLARFHSFDLTEDGHALLSASQLEDSIKLSARPYDLFYLTPRQQAIIGYVTMANRWGFFLVAAVVVVFALLFGASLFWLVMIGAIAALPLKAYFKDEYEGIAQQLYEPPAE